MDIIEILKDDYQRFPKIRLTAFTQKMFILKTQ